MRRVDKIQRWAWNITHVYLNYTGIFTLYICILGASLQRGGDEKRAAASGGRATLREKDIGIGTGSQVPRRLTL